MEGVSSNSKSHPIKGSAQIALGSIAALKGVTSGVRRALGLRIEQHTTNLDAAKKIIKEGCTLNPNYGGTSSAQFINIFEENSKNFIHITGIHKDFESAFSQNEAGKMFLDALKESKWYDRIVHSPLNNFARELYRKIQGLMYRATNTLEFQQGEDMFDTMHSVVDNNFSSPKKTLKSVFDIITGRKTKTFYIAGTDEYFNKNFTPDINDFALKSDKPLKMFKTKLGAMFNALKQEGLSGIKQNKTRVIAGCVIAASCFLIAYKLIKKGINNLKNKDSKMQK
ncbi:hypothetical protein IJ531_04300 [bacterium]|nr:hypothetical protein [bacterium]